MHLTVTDWVALAVSSVFAFIVFGNISFKAGYPRWHGLIMAVPFLNLVALVIFAFSAWPIENKLLKLEFNVSEQAPSAKHN